MDDYQKVVYHRQIKNPDGENSQPPVVWFKLRTEKNPELQTACKITYYDLQNVLESTGPKIKIRIILNLIT